MLPQRECVTASRSTLQRSKSSLSFLTGEEASIMIVTNLREVGDSRARRGDKLESVMGQRRRCCRGHVDLRGTLHKQAGKHVYRIAKLHFSLSITPVDCHRIDDRRGVAQRVGWIQTVGDSELIRHEYILYVQSRFASPQVYIYAAYRDRCGPE